MPDSVVSEKTQSTLLEALNRKAMFFSFANRYAARIKSLPENFVITDEILTEFQQYLREKGFSYEEEAETKIAELRSLASRDRYSKEFMDELTHLETHVVDERDRAFERYEDEVRRALTVEITGRMKGEAARIEASFGGDTQLLAAIGILENAKTYRAILSP